MSMRLINILLMSVCLVMTASLVAARALDVILIRVTDSSAQLWDDICISYISGYVVYLLTTQLPKHRLDKKRVKLVKDEVAYKLERIEVRLKWLNVSKDMVKDEFVDGLKLICYDAKVAKQGTISAYDCLNQIKGEIEELRSFGLPLLLATDRSELMEEFKRTTLRPYFLNRDMNYIRKSEEELRGQQINVGSSLFKLIVALEQLEGNLK